MAPYLQRDIALMERLQRLLTRMVKGMRELPFKERLFFLSSGAVFVETASSPATFSTDALTSRKRGFSRPQRNGTYEDITSKYVVVVSVYSVGKQPNPQGFPERGTVFLFTLSMPHR